MIYTEFYSQATHANYDSNLTGYGVRKACVYGGHTGITRMKVLTPYKRFYVIDLYQPA